MSDASLDRRLSSWKEIAAFFGKDERTVKRWEGKRGLPVHRLPGGKRTTVYAFAHELEDWLRSAKAREEAESSAAATASISPSIPDAQPLALQAPQNRHAVLVAAGILILLGLGAAALLSFPRDAGLATAPMTEIAREHRASPEAFEFYLSGLYHWEKRTPEGLNRAVHDFNAAISRDPQYAEAYVGLANCYNLLREYTLMPADEAYPRAKAAAERAIALNDGLADAHIALAFVEFYWTRDIPRAKREFELGLKLDAGSVRGHHWYATALLHLGEYEHALAEITKAQTLQPQSRSILSDKGLILFYAGRTDEAVRLLKQLAVSEPDYLSPHAYLATIYFARGEYESYLEKAKQAAAMLGDRGRLSVVEAAERGFAAGGKEGMLAAMLDAQKRLYAEGLEPAWSLAQTFARMGDTRNALGHLRLSIDRQEEYVMAILIDRAFLDLHRNERFRRLVVEVGLPPTG